jgi:8-oxo-dGTP diphosphatase
MGLTVYILRARLGFYVMAEKGKYVYDWPRPMVTVDAIVFGFFAGKARLLLINRGNEPFKGQWALPGAFVGIDEELEAAAARELAEETGLEGVALEQMHTFGRCGRDPRGRQITIAFMGIVESGSKKVKAGDDASEARWFDITNLPQDMAFDHNEVAALAISKLKRKSAYRQQPEGKKEPAS